MVKSFLVDNNNPLPAVTREARITLGKTFEHNWGYMGYRYLRIQWDLKEVFDRD